MKHTKMLNTQCGVLVIVAIMVVTAFEIAHAHTNNNPPDPPEITGPPSGRIGNTYQYHILISDPDDDYMDTMEIDFGDENITLIRCCSEPWWRPGDNVTVTHSWDDVGEYVIRARVRDIKGAWSEWGSLAVSMPKQYHSPMWLLYETLNNWLRHVVGREIIPGIVAL